MANRRTPAHSFGTQMLHVTYRLLTSISRLEKHVDVGTVKLYIDLRYSMIFHTGSSCSLSGLFVCLEPMTLVC